MDGLLIFKKTKKEEKNNKFCKRKAIVKII